MNGYTLIRNWYNFKFSHTEKVRHIHSDFYCYLVDQWNRLGQKKHFGLPTSMTMELLQIGSYNTYKKTLDDLIDWGFVELVKDSRNQHQSKIVALSINDEPTDKALDKATIKATDKATDKPTDTIIEQKNNITIEQHIPASGFDFLKALIGLGVDKQVAQDWIKVRFKLKASNTLTAFKKIEAEISKSGRDANWCITKAVEKSWRGFEAKWIENTKHQAQSKSAAHVHTGVQLEQVPTFKNKITL